MGPTSTVVSDLNGDGLPDVVFQNSCFGSPSAAVQNNASVLAYMNDSPGDGLAAPGLMAAGDSLPVALNAILTAYGTASASSTASSSGPPFPTTLGGVRLHIGDSLAQLTYVSPTQINYILPQSDITSICCLFRSGY